MSDIIDRIDALIDEQLAAGEPETGYDYGDPDYPECPECGSDWHGLPRTRTQFGVYDEDGNHKTTVLCEGSDLIGPRRLPQSAPAATEPAIGHAYFRILVDINPDVWARFRVNMERLEAAFAGIAEAFQVNWSQWFKTPSTEVQQHACRRDDINWTPGPHNWHYEMQKPPLQLPRWTLGALTPAEALIRHLWDEFTAQEHRLPEHPGYDFTAYDLDPAHGVFAKPHRRGRR